MLIIAEDISLTIAFQRYFFVIKFLQTMPLSTIDQTYFLVLMAEEMSLLTVLSIAYLVDNREGRSTSAAVYHCIQS